MDDFHDGDTTALTGSDPRIAVIITCHNYEQFVGHAIRSVTNQRRTDCEIFVVDDGSVDGSWDAIQRHGVRAIRTENQGQLAACLVGLAHTTAPFVLFLDADDELKDGALATILQHLTPDVAKLQFWLTQIDQDGNEIGHSLPAQSLPVDRAALMQRVLSDGVYATPPTSGNVFRRDVCEVLREVDYDKAVDGVILFAAPFLGDVIDIPQELGRYRVHQRNYSGIGREINSAILKRDLDRFVVRMDHLRRFLQARGMTDALVDPKDSLFYRERSLGLTIASGGRSSGGDLYGLVEKIWQSALNVKAKAMMTLLYALMAIAPNDRARALLSFRFNAQSRSASALLRALKGS